MCRVGYRRGRQCSSPLSMKPISHAPMTIRSGRARARASATARCGSAGGRRGATHDCPAGKTIRYRSPLNCQPEKSLRAAVIEDLAGEPARLAAKQEGLNADHQQMHAKHADGPAAAMAFPGPYQKSDLIGHATAAPSVHPRASALLALLHTARRQRRKARHATTARKPCRSATR